MGLLNISCPDPINAPVKTTNTSEGKCSKNSVQQGRSRFDARSVLSVRERGIRATTSLCEPLRQSQRTPLATFFNIPLHKKECLQAGKEGTRNSINPEIDGGVRIIPCFRCDPKLPLIYRNDRKKTTANHLLCPASTSCLTLASYFSFNRLFY